MAKRADLRALENQEAQRRLSREDLLEPAIKEREVPIGALGGTVKLRSLSYADRRRIRKASHWGNPGFDEELYETLIICACVVDPKLTEKDVKKLQEQDIAIVDELSLHISQFYNPMTDPEELKKALEMIQNSASNSNSQNGSEKA